ncbi:TRAP transporter small permease [Herbaspirillum sp. RTI4]|uniref:TRAP transporter small permease n=1 Tax=Herbaspirillum sp. RTI4 TaxID=3048640 RepID=UPI002AB453E0|nr:TRAP transporter small permease [Herbaspirillum sp. RTI4]MDY7577104.1 TRAP transporter small permease [Herbaspirillum sp. RTI4]MEA9982846.1 TRAP transporter small permease [Herbaspirillum sp. RTI4]
MRLLTAINIRLAQGILAVAGTALTALGLIVIYGVVLRYAFSDAPPYVEQVALLLVISVAMFGAAAGVRESGHIGLDSVVKKLPLKAQAFCTILAEILILTFAMMLFWGSLEMAISTYESTIPTLGISEAWRYFPPIVAAVLIALFAIEHLLSLLTSESGTTSWN